MKPKVSTKFSCVKNVESVYTGGQVEWFKDMAFILAKGAVKVVRKGGEISELKEEEDQIISFTIGGSDNDLTVVTAHKSGLVCIWDCLVVEQPNVIRTFRSIHSGAISVLGLHTLSGSHSETVLGTEGTVKVWDLTSQYFTHSFKTSSTVCSSLTFPLSQAAAVWRVLHRWPLLLGPHQLQAGPEHGGPLQCAHSLLHHTLWAEGSVLWEGCCVCSVGPDLPQ